MAQSVSTLPADGVAQGDHVCAVLDSAAIQEELVAEFVGAGLERRERVAYYAGDDRPERVLDMLRAGGISTAEPMAQGQLIVVSARYGYLNCQPFDPGRMIAALNLAVDGALADGYSGFRATGELPEADRDVPPKELLAEYEVKVGEVCATRPVAGMCQYDQRRADAALVDAMRELHDHEVRNPLVSANELLRIVPLMDDREGNARYRIVGEADLSNSAVILGALQEAGLGRGDLHLDLGRLRFIDLRGVEALRELTEALSTSRRKLILHNSPPALDHMVELLHGCLPDVEISTQ